MYFGGVNKMTDGSRSSVGEAATAWYSSALTKSYDGTKSGGGNQFGNTLTSGASYNNGRGLSVTFTSALAIKGVRAWCYADVMDASIKYYNGSAWVEIATMTMSTANQDADGGFSVTFNEDGAITSTQWRWETKNYANYSGTANFYAWELEMYTTPVYIAFAGTITEPLSVTNWRVSAHRCADGALEGTTTTGEGGSSYTINCTTFTPTTIAPCNLVLTPKVDYVWSGSKVVTAGEYCIPTNTETTQRRYKCTTGGTTHASTEPTWPASGTVGDGGTVVWTYDSELIDPIILCAKIPT